ncbi:nucleotidyltransferase-like protein [Dyadobacter jejuensis]|uniref:Nucleotidyltransferase-like protein n=1 Tax=Dyadobacter jejuensis TaxID=1082580 RepID=A0A316ARG4_9BACT|nr:nucleotidyltransferase domain-containing protein [Dyadobacter jejuensis]PWJ59420.1 nucleotidyltransferase-like protein [Dyadobacter jejuensis]
MCGLADKTIAAIQGVFVKHPLIEKVFLYGSRAKGSYRNGSDIDLVLVGDALDLSQLYKIELELDDLMLPYKIDLALLHLIENKELIEHLNRRGVVFYEKN